MAPDSDRRLADALQDAELLLDHVVRRHSDVRVDPTLIEPVAGLRAALADGAVDAALEARFFSALQGLAALAAPTTVEALRRDRPARRGVGAVCSFAVWTAAALVFGLFAQALWSTYSGTLREIETGNRRIAETSRTIQLAREQHQDATAAGLQGEWEELMRRALVLYRAVESPPSWMASALGGSTGLGLFERVDYASCAGWAITPACESYLGAATPIEEARKRDVAFLSTYLLPLLWGLIGASIFVIRRLAQQLTHGAIDPILALRYALRILLGGAFGPLIGHLISPETLGFGLGVVPFAAAFLAGYNVEAVLARLDGVSASLGGRPREA